jgi:hypothetical protein
MLAYKIGGGGADIFPFAHEFLAPQCSKSTHIYRGWKRDILFLLGDQSWLLIQAGMILTVGSKVSSWSVKIGLLRVGLTICESPTGYFCR